MHEYFIAFHCQKYICLIKCVLKRNKWKFMNRYEQFSMSPKIFLNFNLLRTDQINCNRLAAYSFACFNKRYVCQITGDRQKERVKKNYTYMAKATVIVPTIRTAISTFYLHLIIFTSKTCTTVTLTEHSSLLAKFIDFSAVSRGSRAAAPW